MTTTTTGKLVSPFEVPSPTENLVNPMNNLVMGMIRPVKGKLGRYVFYLNTSDNPEGRDQHKAIFVAQRVFGCKEIRIGCKYHIYDVSKMAAAKGDDFAEETFTKKLDSRFVGEFRRIRKIQAEPYSGYSLYQGRGEKKVQVQSILFEVSPMMKALTKTTFRTCSVLAFSENKNLGACVDKSQLEKSVNAIYKGKKSILSCQKLQDGIHVHGTKFPVLDTETGKYVLKFGSRGQEPSRRNTQIGNKDQVTMQMAKWASDDYSVDFAAPYNAYQAFGFALAHLEH